MTTRPKTTTLRRKRQQRRLRTVMLRRQRRRRIMYGGNALDTYSSSPMNPGFAIGGMNNFSGPTQISMDAKPVNMV